MAALGVAVSPPRGPRYRVTSPTDRRWFRHRESALPGGVSPAMAMPASRRGSRPIHNNNRPTERGSNRYVRWRASRIHTPQRQHAGPLTAPKPPWFASRHLPRASLHPNLAPDPGARSQRLTKSRTPIPTGVTPHPDRLPSGSGRFRAGRRSFGTVTSATPRLSWPMLLLRYDLWLPANAHDPRPPCRMRPDRCRIHPERSAVAPWCCLVAVEAPRT